MKKNIKSIIITMLFAICCMVFSVNAMADGNFSVKFVPANNKEVYSAGDVVLIDLIVENMPTVDGFQFNLSPAYEDAVFSDIMMEKKDLGLQWDSISMNGNKENDATRYMLMGFMFSGKISGSGTLAQLKVNISDDAKEGTYLFGINKEQRAEFGCMEVVNGKMVDTTYTEKNNGVTFVPCSITIEKPTPQFTTPSSLTATCADELSDVKLPAGFSWEGDTSKKLSVGTVKENVIFTPDDTDKYKTVTGIEVEIKVEHSGKTEVKGTKEATTEAEGYTGDTYCKSCEKLLSKGKSIEKKKTETKPAEEKKEETKPAEDKKEETKPAEDKKEETKPAAPKTAKPGKKVNDKASNGVFKVLKDGKSVEFTKPISAKKTKVTIPNTVTVSGVKCKVTSIAANAFKNNKKITNLTIGKYVNKIGKNAFAGCKNLKAIKINSTLLTKKGIGANAFKGTAAKVKVTVPKKAYKAYIAILKTKGMSKKAVYKKSK